MNNTVFQIKAFSNDIYSVSSELWMKRNVPGGAIMQSWIVKGTRYVMVIDSPVPEIEGFRRFIELQFKLPIIYVNTHGHIDHIGCNNQFEKVYLAKEDWLLAAGGGIVPATEETALESLRYELLNIENGKKIDLGGRIIEAYKLPGHTKGSVVFYDSVAGALFSGDAIARRVLYGMSQWVPLKEYLDALKQIETCKITNIYSMHDDFALPADMPQRIINNITKYLKTTKDRWQSPVDGKWFRRIQPIQNEEDIAYFDFVIPEEKREEYLNENEE